MRHFFHPLDPLEAFDRERNNLPALQAFITVMIAVALDDPEVATDVIDLVMYHELLHKALGLWGLSFFTRPLSLVLIGLIVLTIAFAVYKNLKPTRPLQTLSTAP